MIPAIRNFFAYSPENFNLQYEAKVGSACALGLITVTYLSIDSIGSVFTKKNRLRIITFLAITFIVAPSSIGVIMAIKGEPWLVQKSKVLLPPGFRVVSIVAWAVIFVHYVHEGIKFFAGSKDDIDPPGSNE